MRKRTMLVVIAIVVLGVLAISSTAAAMTWGHTNLVGNGYGYSGMMNGQQGYNDMMRRYQQGAPVTGVTSLTIQNSMYQPANVQVPVGTTLSWANQDNVPHSVTFKNGLKDSGLLAQGQSFSYTFTTAGTYQYYCTVHPSMVATVTVTK